MTYYYAQAAGTFAGITWYLGSSGGGSSGTPVAGDTCDANGWTITIAAAPPDSISYVNSNSGGGGFVAASSSTFTWKDPGSVACNLAFGASGSMATITVAGGMVLVNNGGSSLTIISGQTVTFGAIAAPCALVFGGSVSFPITVSGTATGTNCAWLAPYGIIPPTVTGVFTPGLGTLTIPNFGIAGYTYGDSDATKVLTTAAGAGTYVPVAASAVQKGISVGVSPAAGTMVGIVDSSGTLHSSGVCSSSQAWAASGIVDSSAAKHASGILDGSAAYTNSGIWDGSARTANGIFDGSARTATGIFDGSTQYATGLFDGSARHATGILDATPTYHASGIWDTTPAWHASTGLTASLVKTSYTWYDYNGQQTGSYDPVTGSYTDPGAANVVTGTSYEFAGSSKSGSYPTTATSYAAGQAAQLATDEAAVAAVAAGIVNTVTVLGTTGTINLPLDESEAAATQLAADQAAVTSHAGGVTTATTILGVTGTLELPDVGEVAYGIDRGDGSTGTRTDCPAAAAVTGSSYGAGGTSISGSYPTTAASQAAQLAADQAAVTSYAAGVTTATTILGVTGRLDMSLYVAIANVVSADSVLQGVPLYSSGPTGTYSGYNLGGLTPQQAEQLLAAYQSTTTSGGTDMLNPVAANGDISLVAGNDYNRLLGNPITIDASQWPDLTGATVTLQFELASTGAPDGAAIEGNVLAAGTAEQAVQLALSGAFTSALQAGVGTNGYHNHTYTLKPAWTATKYVCAPPRGNASVYVA